MSANLQFVPGDFRTYVAAQKFHLGKVEADIAKGAILQFDGATLRFAGKEYTYPELRSAIKASWLVEGEAVGSVSPPAPVAATAPKSVAEAKAAIPAPAATKYAVDREQDVAATFPNRNKQAVSADTPKAFNPTVLREDEGDNRNVGPAVRSAGSKIGNDIGGAETGTVVARFSSPSAGKKVDVSENAMLDTGATVTVEHKGPRAISSEDGVAVAQFKTAKNTKVTITDSQSVEREIRKIEAATKPVARPTTAASSVLSSGDEVHAAASDKLETIIAALDPNERAKIAAEQRKLQVAASLAKQAEEEGAEVAPTAPVVAPETVVPPVVAKPKVKPPQSVEEAIVRGDEMEIAPGVFWNKKLHWRTRAKVAIDSYKDKPEILALIRAYEEKSVVALIDEHLARLAKK